MNSMISRGALLWTVVLGVGLTLPLTSSGCSRDRPVRTQGLPGPLGGHPGVCSVAFREAAAPTSQRVCKAGCRSAVRLDTEGKPFRAVSPTTVDGKNIGLTPSDIRSAYNIPGLPEGAAVPTIAIVVEGDNPHAENDLHVYRTTFGLSECTIKSGCLRKINAAGGDTLPPVCTDNAGWATEIMNDLEAASAVCPACNLLLIEADDEGGGAHTKYDAIEVAAKLGATVIINSWNNPAAFGSPEIEARLNHPGVFFAGDDGGYCPPPCTDNPNAELPYPASSQYVWAVGGTKLVRDASARGWHETVWNQLAEAAWQRAAVAIRRSPNRRGRRPWLSAKGLRRATGARPTTSQRTPTQRAVS